MAIPVSFDRVTKVRRVSNEAEPLARLQKTMDQPDSYVKGAENESSGPPADPSDRQPTELGLDRVIGHCSTGIRTDYNVRWYGYGAERDTYERATELSPRSVGRYWAARRRYHGPRFERTGERRM